MDLWLNGTTTLFAVVVLLVVLAGWLRARGRTPTRRRMSPLLPPDLTLRPQPLLTKVEAELYNLLQLAAQDHFLVFAQIPLWALVEIRAQTPQARAVFLSRTALRRVDFVLVHPGTLAVAKVILLEEDPPSGSALVRRGIIEGVLKAAGIEYLRLNPHQTHTLPGLTRQLGLESAQ